MKNFWKVLLVLLVVVLLAVGLYFGWNYLVGLGYVDSLDISEISDSRVNPEGAGVEDDEDYDNFPHKAFPRFYDLGEPDMVIEDTAGCNMDGSPEVWHVYGVDTSQESRLKGIRSLDYKEAVYCLCDSFGDSEYFAPDEFASDETYRVLLRNLHMTPSAQEKRAAIFDVIYYGDELWEKDPDAANALSNDEAFRVTDFRFGGVVYLQTGGRIWINGELTEDKCDENLKDDIYMQAISYWDGVSESIIMYCKDPSSPRSDIIIHLYDIVYDPELPDYLFEPPAD